MKKCPKCNKILPEYADNCPDCFVFIDTGESLPDDVVEKTQQYSLKTENAQYCNIFHRIIAYLIDSGLIVGVFMFFQKYPIYSTSIVANRLLANGVTILILWILYFIVFLGSFGGTIGMMIFGLKVVSLQEQSIGYLKAIYRLLSLVLLKSIPVVNGFLGIITLACIIKTPRRQALHDLMTRTMIIEIFPNLYLETAKRNIQFLKKNLKKVILGVLALIMLASFPSLAIKVINRMKYDIKSYSLANNRIVVREYFDKSGIIIKDETIRKNRGLKFVTVNYWDEGKIIKKTVHRSYRPLRFISFVEWCYGEAEKVDFNGEVYLRQELFTEKPENFMSFGEKQYVFTKDGSLVFMELYDKNNRLIQRWFYDKGSIPKSLHDWMTGEYMVQYYEEGIPTQLKYDSDGDGIIDAIKSGENGTNK